MAFTSTILIYSLLALSFAVIWQVLGSQLLALITKKIFSDQNFAHLVAWVAWPAWSGAMAFSVFIVARPWHKEALILGAIAILGAGAFTLRHGRIPQRQLSRTSRAVFGLLIVFALLTLLVAATPQQLYDQMNYHLVVAKIAMRQGSLQGSLDNHILMTGIYEYGLLWARALWDNDLFAWGVGQATTWVVCFGTLLWLGVICFREHREVDSDHLRLGCFLTFCLSVIAYNLPESVTFRMFKPDSLIFAVVCVVLFARQWQSKQDFVKSFLILAPIILALKFTGIHPVIALLGLAIGSGFTLRHDLLSKQVFWLPIWCIPFVLVLAKNYFLLSKPIYPAAQNMFPSPYSDASTVAYWQSVAGKSDVHFYSGFLGYVNLLKETGPIAVMSFASGFLVLVTKGRRDFKEAFSVIIFFIVSFALIWPLFYSGNIFPRFVAGGLAGLILLLYVMMSRLAWLLPRKFLWLLPLVGLSVSGMDTTWSRLKKWASESTDVYLARSVETYSAGRLVNQSLDPEQLVVSDDPAKYLFDENLAYFSSHAGVAERKIAKELKEDFWAAVRRYKIGAFVVHPLTDLSDLARKQDCKETKTNNEVTVFLLNECRKRS